MAGYSRDVAFYLSAHDLPSLVDVDTFARVATTLAAHLAVDPKGAGDVTVNAADLARVLVELRSEIASLEDQLQYGNENS